MPPGNPEAYGDPAALAAMAGEAPAGPVSPDVMGEEAGEVDPEQDDKIMLVDDFRNAPPEDALAAFEALLAAFNVKRS